MRNSILVTAFIALLAGALILSIAQSDHVRSWFGASEEREYTAEIIADNQQDATETNEAVAEKTAEEVTEQVAEETEGVASSQADITAALEEKAAKLEARAAQIEQEIAAASGGNANAVEAESVEAAEESGQEYISNYTVDIEASLKDRFIGDANAPVVVEEFSSLTCPHCAFFHNSIFPKIKEKYIDTGKVRWIIRGFPLNEPALRAEMVARCAPNDQYLKLIDVMYENQPKWAFDANPMAALSIMLRVAGVTNDVFNACATNVELETALIEKIESLATSHSINSTPTFILDGHKTVSGAGTFVGFSYDLDAILRRKGLLDNAANDDAAAKAESAFTNQ